MHWTILAAARPLLPRLRARLARRHPRLAMLGIVAVAAAAGTLGSAALLRTGVDHLVVRWPLGVALAWAALLLQLRLWVACEARALAARGLGVEPRGEGAAPASSGGTGHGAEGLEEVAADALELALRPAGPSWSGGGGNCAGGGATGTFDGGGGTPERAVQATPGGPGLDLDLTPDLDLDGWPILAGLAVAVAALGGAVASAYLVWMAPQLLADLVFESVVAAALYRRVWRGEPPRTAWAIATARTAAPALIALACFALAGGLLEYAFPGVRSLPEATRALREHRWRGSDAARRAPAPSVEGTRKAP